MRTIEEMTNLILSHKNGERWSWESFWTKIVGKELPKGKLATIYYKRNRLIFY